MLKNCFECFDKFLPSPSSIYSSKYQNTTVSNSPLAVCYRKVLQQNLLNLCINNI